MKPSTSLPLGRSWLPVAQPGPHPVGDTCEDLRGVFLADRTNGAETLTGNKPAVLGRLTARKWVGLELRGEWS